MTVSLFALCEPAIRRPCPLTELSRVGTALRDSRQALTTNASTAAEVVLANALVAKFNALLAGLRDSGVIAGD